MTRTLIIGLDSATWDIIKPLADEGPTFKKLMEEGVWGDLESTLPPSQIGVTSTKSFISDPIISPP